MLFAVRLTVLMSLCVMLFSSVFAGKTASQSWVTGYWQTIDTKTNKPSSIIWVRAVNHVYEGSIVKIYKEDHHLPTDICTHCTGNQKNKPMLGLTIIKAMRCSAYACTDGRVLDPRDGSLYHASMALIDNGNRLKLRGYIGIPLFGKTVVWNRVSYR